MSKKINNTYRHRNLWFLVVFAFSLAACTHKVGSDGANLGSALGQNLSLKGGADPANSETAENNAGASATESGNWVTELPQAVRDHLVAIGGVVVLGGGVAACIALRKYLRVTPPTDAMASQVAKALEQGTPEQLEALVKDPKFRPDALFVTPSGLKLNYLELGALLTEPEQKAGDKAKILLAAGVSPDSPSGNYSLSALNMTSNLDFFRAVATSDKTDLGGRRGDLAVERIIQRRLDAGDVEAKITMLRILFHDAKVPANPSMPLFPQRPSHTWFAVEQPEVLSFLLESGSQLTIAPDSVVKTELNHMLSLLKNRNYSSDALYRSLQIVMSRGSQNGFNSQYLMAAGPKALYDAELAAALDAGFPSKLLAEIRAKFTSIGVDLTASQRAEIDQQRLQRQGQERSGRPGRGTQEPIERPTIHR